MYSKFMIGKAGNLHTKNGKEGSSANDTIFRICNQSGKKDTFVDLDEQV